MYPWYIPIPLLCTIGSSTIGVYLYPLSVPIPSLRTNIYPWSVLIPLKCKFTLGSHLCPRSVPIFNSYLYHCLAPKYYSVHIAGLCLMYTLGQCTLHRSVPPSVSIHFRSLSSTVGLYQSSSAYCY